MVLDRACLTLIGALFAFAACAWAQEGAPSPDAAISGSIHGVVTSPDGTVYEGARIVLEWSGAAAPPAETQQTDSDGAFTFTDLKPGAFKLTISAHGFSAQTIRGVLQAGEAFDAHTITLPVAAAASEVRVSAEPQAEIAQEQLHLEEQQRVLGVFPNFYVSYDPHAVPLTARQKYQLAWKTEIDPITWAMTGAIAGLEQAANTFPAYGQGAGGYGLRFGANYADGFFGNELGGAVFPALFKQDPRYFYKGTGTIRSRVMYAIANAVICKGDNGHWQFNYSAFAGSLAAGGIANFYYPASDRGSASLLFETTAIGAGEGAVQNLIQEFVIRKLTPKLPHYGTGTP